MGRNKNHIAAAVELRKRYTPEELREVMQLDAEELAALEQIARGKPPRNAMAILKAIELKAAYAYSKPKTEVEVNGKLSVNVNITRNVPKDPDGK